MSASQAQKTPWVRGFVGEDINNLPSMIPPNVAQDARNTDYWRGTALKRSGFIRLDDRPMMGGGISIRLNGVTPGNIGNISWAPAGYWAVSMSVQMEKASCSGTPYLLRCGTPGADGFGIQYDPTNDRFIATVETSAGTKTINSTTGGYTNNTVVSLMLAYTHISGNNEVVLFVDTSSFFPTTLGANTYTAPGAPVLRWAYNGATVQTVKFWLDEVRIWDLSIPNDAAWNAFVSLQSVDLIHRRELTTAEMALATLTKLYRFNLSEFTFGSGFSATDGSGVFAIPVPTLGVGVYTKENAVGRGLVNAHYDPDWPRCTALTLWPSDFGECWVRFGNEIYVHTNQTTVSPAIYASRIAEIHTIGAGVPTTEAWSICRYRNRLVGVHPHIGCFHIGPPTGSPTQFRALVPIRPDPTVGPVTATDSGAGTGPGANVNEVQTVTITGAPTGGTFKLQYVGQKTAAIAYNATAATVKTELVALSTIGEDNVTVAGAVGGPYTVTFVGELAATDVALLVKKAGGLTGGTSPDVTVAETTKGIPVQTFLFKFFYRNSVTGVHSPSNTTPLSVAMATSNAIQLNLVTTLFGLRRPLDGADYIDIFRTKAGGSTYYLMESVALSATPTTPHTSAAINLADASIAETNSEINLRYYLADRIPLRARAAFEHRGLLVLVAPDEDGLYNVAGNYRDTFHSAIMWSDPLAIHLFSTDNYKEVLPDVSDYLTGGTSVIGGALLAKRYSLVAAFGENLGQASYRHISHTIGCLAHNSIAASDQYVYLLSDKGIARVPVSIQPGSAQLVQQERFKALFDDIDPARVGTACGVYWSPKQQYWCSFDTVNNGRVTLVFNEQSNAIARYDHEIEAFYVYASNDPTVADTKLVGSWRGYMVELDASQADGADINATTITLTGTVTAADAQSLTDTGQAWGTTGLYGSITAQSPYARLAGLKIKVTRTSDGAEQTNTIYFNSATRLWAETPWSWTPIAGDTFVIAGINWYWKSGMLCPHGDPGEREHGLRMRFLQTKQASADYVNLDVWVDDVPIAANALTGANTNRLATNTRRREFLVNTRVYEVEFQLSNDEPNAPFELEAFQVELQEAKVRA